MKQYKVADKTWTSAIAYLLTLVKLNAMRETKTKLIAEQGPSKLTWAPCAVACHLIFITFVIILDFLDP